ncbi:hypothetical protein JCM19235_6322 [Vibrio maritimus]|uniref:Uncharacterized protein n=1 Tax=Vibrio maritimus TaxID=990268 RepID=A0A090RU62_9VIBR|nr:hypothetical protein JCM19235_6322 [Vibrio maritimus]
MSSSDLKRLHASYHLCLYNNGTSFSRLKVDRWQDLISEK